MTPAEFQSLAFAWITVITAVVGAVIGAGFSIYAAFRARSAETQSRLSSERLDRHSLTLRSQSERISDIALRTPTEPSERILPTPARQRPPKARSAEGRSGPRGDDSTEPEDECKRTEA